MKEKKLGQYLLLEFNDKTLTLYKKWSKAELFEATDYIKEFNNSEEAAKVFNEINLKNVYERLGE